MTIAELQDLVYSELSEAFSDYCLRSAEGEPTTEIKIFKQDLPVPETDDDEEETPPFIIVRVTNGEQSDWEEAHEVDIAVIICVWDNAKERQGSKDVMSIITRIQNKIMRHPALNGLFKPPFKWALNDENTFPYYYGACQFKATVSAVRRESPLA